mgnify:FL=1
MDRIITMLFEANVKLELIKPNVEINNLNLTNKSKLSEVIINLYNSLFGNHKLIKKIIKAKINTNIIYLNSLNTI